MKKSKIYIKRIISLVIFISVLTVCLWYLNMVLIPKRTDGILTMQNFYAQEENTIDVLLLGSSHNGMNYDVSVLWDEFGMSGYSLWGSVQPFWNSYFSLKEALKTQSPSVVVLDTFASTQMREHSDYPRQVTNVSGMKFSLNKLEAICVSAHFDRWDDLLLGTPLYHQRYSTLSENDFSHFPWSDGLIEEKGTDFRYGIGNVTIPDVSGMDECLDLYDKEEKYLIKIIELCKKENLPLVLTATPTMDRTREQPYYNSVAKIAEEYGIDFINFNLLDNETGITADDYWTDDDHLNTNGTRKVSHYLGEYLDSKYDIADHRGEPGYESWDAFSKKIREGYFKYITDPADLLAEIERNNSEVVIIKNTDSDITVCESVSDGLKNLGLDMVDFNGCRQGVWHLTRNDGKYTAEKIMIDDNTAKYNSCSGEGEIYFNGGSCSYPAVFSESSENDITILVFYPDMSLQSSVVAMEKLNSGVVRHIK